MNILRHKKWHVRTKENVARVRRDEAKAAEEEKARAERAELADHEDRIQRLRSKNIGNTSDVANVPDIFGSSVYSQDCMSGTSCSTSARNEHHVNLFKELEEQERKNFANGNKEYAAEKKKEQDDWESKVGIMKRFAEDTKEYSKDNEWWEGIPLMREHDKKPSKVSKSEKKFLTSEERKAIKLKKDKKKKRKDKIKGIEQTTHACPNNATPRHPIPALIPSKSNLIIHWLLDVKAVRLRIDRIANSFQFLLMMLKFFLLSSLVGV
uniref:CBF1-interacting co-repressor CIR N-terminal domain-containing protein n=1 Tax=Meloidogyne enterolobii TaxID=390850 RepID=A0A6V7UJ24_MELEN|nr:unnamed protein product [Meloidogyne enterolobii]